MTVLLKNMLIDNNYTQKCSDICVT